MALRELPYRTATALCRDARPAIQPTWRSLFCSHASTAASTAAAAPEVETTSFADTAAEPEAAVKDFDPIARSRARRRGNKQLPASR